MNELSKLERSLALPPPLLSICLDRTALTCERASERRITVLAPSSFARCVVSTTAQPLRLVRGSIETAAVFFISSSSSVALPDPFVLVPHVTRNGTRGWRRHDVRLSSRGTKPMHDKRGGSDELRLLRRRCGPRDIHATVWVANGVALLHT
uniref:Polyketide synthase n=1 Tax=Peronospora matthiolae TaxID=2874970 RepID=A0AAV1U097_9STRA